MAQDKEPDSTQPRKPALNWRFEFGSYGAMRLFLDQLADLSKRENFYPNINFGKTYVNISIDGDGQTELGVRQASFVQTMETLAAQK